MPKVKAAWVSYKSHYRKETGYKYQIWSYVSLFNNKAKQTWLIVFIPAHIPFYPTASNFIIAILKSCAHVFLCLEG